MTETEIEPIPLTAADAYNVRAVNSMLHIARERTKRRRGNPAPFWNAAGQHLAKLRRGHSKAIFAEIVWVHCDLGISRAYELMAVAGGTPLAKIRAKTATRVRRLRNGRAPRGRKRANSIAKSEA